jgi:starvation-inducible outer membrane lipoprotein
MSLFKIVLVGVPVFLMLAGCSAHPKRIDCEQHLQPINAPAPVSKTPESRP